MKLLRKVPDFFGLLSALLIALIWIIMTAELVARNVFHSPILGVSEIAIYLYVTAAYFGFSYTQKEKGHICVELLYDRLGQQTRRVVDVIAYLLCDALFLCFAVCIWRAFGESWAIKEIQLSAMKMPVYVLKFTIALGITAMLLQLILDTVDAVKLALGQGGNNVLMEEEKL